MLCGQFLAAGVASGEHGVLVTFEERIFHVSTISDPLEHIEGLF